MLNMCMNIVVHHLVKHHPILITLSLSQLKIRKILQILVLFLSQVLHIFFAKIMLTMPGSLGTRVSAIKLNKFDLTKLKLWNSDDADLLRFDESTHCQIGKWAIFKVE